MKVFDGVLVQAEFLSEPSRELMEICVVWMGVSEKGDFDWVGAFDTDKGHIVAILVKPTEHAVF